MDSVAIRLKSFVVAVLGMVCLTAGVRADGLRYDYTRKDGAPVSFVEVGRGQWSFQSPQGTIPITETLRTQNFIELFDPSRGRKFRIWGNGSSFTTVGPDWFQLAEGGRLYEVGGQGAPAAPPAPPNYPQPRPSAYQPSAAFPIRTEKFDVIMDKCDMRTNVVLSNNGRLDGHTRLSCGRKFLGFTGGVSVGVYDINGNVLYMSSIHRWGIDGPLPGQHTQVREDDWSEQVPPNVLSQARYLGIAQMHTPNPVLSRTDLDQFKGILFQAGKNAAAALGAMAPHPPQ